MTRRGEGNPAAACRTAPKVGLATVVTVNGCPAVSPISLTVS
jgi:hypothetical protein